MVLKEWADWAEQQPPAQPACPALTAASLCNVATRLRSGATGQIKCPNRTGSGAQCTRNNSLLLLLTNTSFFQAVTQIYFCVYLLCKA